MPNEKTRSIEIAADLLLSYDDESPEFKQALEDFQEYIQQSGTEDDLLEYVAYNIGAFSPEEIIDCIGKVSLNGDKPSILYCGIDVQCDTDCLNNLIFEVN